MRFKYRPGDKVVITDDFSNSRITCTDEMKARAGTFMTVRDIATDTSFPCYYMFEDQYEHRNNPKPGWLWDERCLEDFYDEPDSKTLLEMLT